ncbi:MAG: indole-3-glycerol phosphate synthase TrpC [Gemmatales bacterium]
MPTILDQIVISKRQEIASAKVVAAEDDLELALREQPIHRTQGRFLASLRASAFIRVIAEVKRFSPSAGPIQVGADAVSVAREYQRCGAACISVLTDGPYFGGNLKDLLEVRQAVQTPVLRKDFILERYQVLQAKLAGADAVLLIAEILDDATMAQLIHDIELLGMDALVECYEADNVQRVVDAGARLIGINNRNLHTFEVTLEHTLELAKQVPGECTLVSESGIKSRADVERLASAGIKAILVGETLMRCGDMEVMMTELSTVPHQPR